MAQLVKLSGRVLTCAQGRDACVTNPPNFLKASPPQGRYERASTLITSNRPVEDWGKLLGDTAAVTALLDRLLHHAHVLTCGPRSWRTRLHGERGTSSA